MNISNLIVEARKSKNLTQEDLADLSKVNLRTIQRIENKENNPRGNTLKLICNALEIDLSTADLTQNTTNIENPTFSELILNYFFLLIINLSLISIIGFMTLDSERSRNSIFAGLLLSFFMNIFIVFKTSRMNRAERTMKYGSGYFVYFLIVLIVSGFITAWTTGLLFCLLISLFTLFYGDRLINEKS
jgi:transcriptional regulator with XRE-family HTH domain